MSNKKKLQPNTRREELRRQQELEESQARRRKMLIVAGVVLTISAILVAIVLIVNSQKETERLKVDTPQVSVTNLAANQKGIQVHASVEPAPDAPVVEVYEDYQCPACQAVEEAFGSFFDELAQEGKIKLQYNTRTFLDMANKTENKNSSTRAAIAAACSDNVGKYAEYHKVIFENQPREGRGFSDSQLADGFAKRAGIEGEDLTKFQQCYDGEATKEFVQNLDETASRAGMNSTPTVLVNGKKVELEEMAMSVRSKDEMLVFLKRVK